MDQVREHILASMRRTLGNVSSNGGAMCLLSGSAGMGKTHLARSFIQQLPDDATTLIGSVPPTGTPPLMPICRALASDEREFVVEEISSTVVQYSQGVPLLRETLGPMLKKQRVTRLSGVCSEDVAPKETHTFFVLSEILRRVAARRRTVLFIDDVQWLDASSSAFLGFLAEDLAKVPLFVVLSARTNGTEPQVVSSLRAALGRAGEGAFLSYKLPPLSVEETIEVADRFLQGRLQCSPTEAEWLRRTSKGIPQYLREVLALLQERGALVPVAGAWRFLEAPEGLILPPSLCAVTLARLESAVSGEAEAETVIHYAAICGVRFDARIIAGPAGVSTQRAMSCLQSVAGATGFVRRLGRTTEWEFDHALTREAVLDHIGDLARDLHHDVARILARNGKTHSITIAFHLREAGAWREAAESYRQAAGEAAQRFAFADAVEAAEREEAMLVQAGSAIDTEERLELAERFGRFLIGAQRYQQATDYLWSRHQDGLTKGRPLLLHSLGRAKLNLPDASSHADAVEILRTAGRQLGFASEPAAAVLIWTELVLAYEAVGEHQAAQAAFRRAYAEAQATNDPRWLIRVMRLTCIFWQPEKVIEATDQALALARTHRLRFEEALCWNNLGTQHWYLRQLDRARECFDVSLQMLSSCGGYRKDVPTNNLGLIALVEERHQDAIDLFRSARESSLTPDDGLLIRMNEAVALAKMGELDAALALLWTLAGEADAAGDPFHRDCVRYNLARALLKKGNTAEAIAELLACQPRHWLTDDALIFAKRAGLLLEAHATLEWRADPEWERQRALLDVTTKPQAWLYRMPWELGDIQFWQD